MDEKKRDILLSILVMMIGIMVTGGTFAYLTFALNVENGEYKGKAECFSVDYSINNDDGTQDITGTMFPSAGPSNGLSGKVAINMSTACNVTGTGSLILDLGDETSSMFGTIADSHCENSTTLETMNDYENETDCINNNGTWVTDGTVLKYAVYSSDDTTQTPLNVGYFDSSAIGSEQVIYEGFVVNQTRQSYYVYLWLDGHLTDDTFVNLPFTGSIKAKVVQNKTS